MRFLTTTPWIIFGFVFSILITNASAEPRENASIFAATSLRDVINDVAKVFAQDHPERMHFNFAGSNVLAQQITAGAHADIYLSANQDWMDFVEEKTKTIPNSRQNILANRLVIVAHQKAQFNIEKPEDLAKASFRYLALGNPDAVPAGKYAKEYFEKIPYQNGTLWNALKKRIAPAPDVREALHLVESDPSVMGIVYKTDAMISKTTKVLYEISEETIPIFYTVTQIQRGDSPKVAKEFYDFLFSKKALLIYEKHGFTLVGKTEKQKALKTHE